MEFNDNTMPIIIKNYLNYMTSVKGASHETVKGYTSDLQSFCRFLIYYYNELDGNENQYHIQNIPLTNANVNKKFIKKIELDDIYTYFTYLEEDKNNSKKTRARKVACYKSFFNFLYKKAKVLENNIMEDLESPKLEKRLPIFLTEDECMKLVHSIDTRNSARDKCVLVFFLNTGIRLSELCNINMSDIQDNKLTVIGKGDKQRIVPLNKTCIKYLNSYLEVRINQNESVIPSHRDALFLSEQYRRISKRSVEYIMEKAVAKAELSDKYSVHKLRHTAATMLYSAGVGIRTLQEILGHEDISTTQIYTHINKKTIEEALEKNPLNDLL